MGKDVRGGVVSFGGKGSMWLWCIFFSSARVAARDQDFPSRLTPVVATNVRACEGFFTLGRPTLLVIGSEERLDCQIHEEDFFDESSLSSWDQPRYERERNDAIARFRRRPCLDGTIDIPPGLQMVVNNRILYTASPGEQARPLNEALRILMASRTNGAWLAIGADGVLNITTEDPRPARPELREAFYVRDADSVAPTLGDIAALRGSRSPPSNGILIVRAGATFSLIIF